MKAIDAIRWALEMTSLGTAELVEDMRHAPLTQPIVREGRGAGNHPLWIMGHLAYIEGSIPGILLGEEVAPNPVAHWRVLFAPGTEPKADAGAYPAFDEVVTTFHELRAGNLCLLDEIGEEGLDRVPKSIPPGFEEAMATTGRALLLIALHQMVHYGQIADARRAAGRKPLM